MGLHRRKANQLAEAEAKATQDMAAAHRGDSSSMRPRQAGAAAGSAQRPGGLTATQRMVCSYLVTVALGVGFWALVKALHKHSAHWA
jgi:hypothetical protein